MNYKKRITDSLLDEKLQSFGGVLIVGPKGCGKTTSAKQFAKSFIELQDEEKRDMYIATAETAPSKLLIGAKPRLIDEWQDIPKIWGCVRKSIDDEQNVGLYILTGSSSKDVKTPHTGTMRISSMMMYPMSLYESGESNGEVSLIDLFNNNKYEGCVSNLTIDDLIYAICRGGWPTHFKVTNPKYKLNIAKDLYYQTCHKDISAIDDVKRNPLFAENIMKSYARNICTLSSKTTVFKDTLTNTEMSENTFKDYLSALEKLYIITDIDAWCPAIRSQSAIRASKKRNFIDPSIAVAALGLSPEYFNLDFKTLGFLFECLCIRDLKIYSSKYGGRVSYYHDRYGLEADCVLHLEDGRYAIIEFKLGGSGIEEGAKHLCEIERLVKEFNEKEKQCKLRLPDLKIVITGGEYGYKRKDGVLVIPIGCLKD